MSLRCGVRVLPVDLDRLVTLGGDQTAPALVESHIEDTILGTHAAGLRDGLEALELVAAAPVPEVEVAVVRPRHQDRRASLRFADGARVDDGPVAGDVPLERALRALPDLVVVGGAGHKRVLRGVESNRPHALLVVRERDGALTGGKIPKPDHVVHGAANELRLRGLRGQRADSAGMAGEDEDPRLGAHVPDAHGGVPPTCC
mmetsp:Transcript_81522/g.239392  ORF Transcript_81522/g.239392 Transcript_81522/m.239392 type:complete len:202 (+) Transcript_81522:114-719(+)